MNHQQTTAELITAANTKAAEDYDRTLGITGSAAAIGISTGDWALYNAAYQRLQVDARNAITARVLAEAAAR